MGKPLEGIRVLDLTRVLSGPMCCVILEDLGAEVIKIERPVTGDDSRAYGPFIKGQSLYFMTANRGKKSIELDLKNPGAIEIFKKLVEKADMVIENYRPGTMEKMGIGWDVLKEINPRLVYGAISGFGTTGPESRRAAYDILIQAQSGLMSITGLPDIQPVRVGYSVSDINGALYCAIGVLAALNERNRTGKGQKVDIAMLDCQFAVLESAFSRYFVTGKSPTPLGNRHPTITPFQGFKGTNGWFVLAAGNDHLFATLCNAIGAPQLITDPRFITNKDRSEHLDEIGEELQKVFDTNTKEYWLELIDSVGVPCAPVNDMEGVAADEQLKARNMFVHCMDPIAGDVLVPGNPIKMESIEEETTRKAPPQLGADRDEILKGLLGMDDETIAGYGAVGAFGKRNSDG